VDSRQNNATSGSNTASLDTDIKLPLDMGIKASADIGRENRDSFSANSRSRQSTLPDVTFRWDNLDRKIPFLKKYENTVKSVSLSSHYTLDYMTEWVNNSVQPTTDRTKKSYSPLLSMNGVVLGGVQTTLSFSKSTETTQTLSGEVVSTEIRDQTGTDASFRYSISPNSGLLRKLKLQSKIDLDMRLATSQSQQARRVADKPLSVVAKDTSWSVSPQASYQFSQRAFVAELPFQHALLRTQLGVRTRSANQYLERLRLDRLLLKPVGAQLVHGLHSCFDVAERGQYDCRRHFALLAQFFQKTKSVETRHVQVG
jgi:hypothetical protein